MYRFNTNMSKKYKYYDFNMHFKDEETLLAFKRIIVAFKSSHQAGQSIISAYNINPHLFKPKFV